MNDIEKARKKKEEREAGFHVTHGTAKTADEIIADVSSGKTIMYDSELYVVFNKEAIENGQVTITKRPLEPRITKDGSFCSDCDTAVYPSDNYCRNCGVPLDWSNRLKVLE